jgi:hypothetical protein
MTGPISQESAWQPDQIPAPTFTRLSEARLVLHSADHLPPAEVIRAADLVLALSHSRHERRAATDLRDRAEACLRWRTRGLVLATAASWAVTIIVIGVAAT